MRGDQQDDVGVGVVGGGAVVAAPERVAEAGARRADVGVGVVAVDAPGEQHALDEAILAVAADVVHHLVVAALLDRLADPPGDVIEGVIPGHALELRGAAWAGPLERVEDALGILGLVDRRRALGAIAPTGSGMGRVALDLDDLFGLLVDVGEQAARGLAVEACRRHQHVVLLDLLGVRLGVVHHDVVPGLDRRIVRQCASRAHAECFGPGCIGAVRDGHVSPQDSGTSWPALT